MQTIRTAHVWASLIACLAIAGYSVGSAIAQQQGDEANQSNQQQDQAQSDQQSTDSQSSSQSAEQNQQKSQQDQAQRDSESAQRDEQSRQREDQQRKGTSSEQWNDSDSRDQWNDDRSISESRGREWPSRQFNRDERSLLNRNARDASRWSERGASGEQGASLGVNISTDDGPGVVLIRIHEGSPAERMGLRTRDRITQVNGQPVRSVSNFITRIREMRPGSEVELAVTRDRNEQTFRGELESRNEAFAFQNQSRRYYDFDRDSGDRGNWQTSYDEEDSGPTQYNPRDSASRIQVLERQADRLARQVEELRDAIREARQSGAYRSRGETPARYEENPSNRSRETRAYERWQSDDSGRFRQGSESNSPYGRDAERRSNDSSDANRQWRDSSRSSSNRSSTNRSDRYSDDSPGGETGEERLNVGTEETRE